VFFKREVVPHAFFDKWDSYRLTSIELWLIKKYFLGINEFLIEMSKCQLLHSTARLHWVVKLPCNWQNPIRRNRLYFLADYI
jgi:hypothetical protein